MPFWLPRSPIKCLQVSEKLRKIKAVVLHQGSDEERGAFLRYIEAVGAQIHSFLTSSLRGGERSGSSPSRLTNEREFPRTQ